MIADINGAQFCDLGRKEAYDPDDTITYGHILRSNC